MIIAHDDGTPWYPGYIPAIKEIRQQTGLGLRETLILMAEIFGFPEGMPEKTIRGEERRLAGWHRLRKFSEENYVSFENIRGPHALTLLKALAVRHGRKNVSTLRL